MEAEQKESLIRIVTAALLTAGAHLFMDAGPMKPGESLVTRLWESLPLFCGLRRHFLEYPDQGLEKYSPRPGF